MHAIGVSKREIWPLFEWECHEKQENKTKLLFFGNEAWCSDHKVMVVAGQPANQGAVWEGHPQ